MKDLKVLVAVIIVMVITAIAVNKTYGETAIPAGNQETTVKAYVPTTEQLEKYNKEMLEYHKAMVKYQKQYNKAMVKYQKANAKYDKGYKAAQTKVNEAKKAMADAATNTDYRIARAEYTKALKEYTNYCKNNKSPEYPSIEMPKFPEYPTAN